MLHFSFWDYMLIIVVTAQATLLAYTYTPKWKGLILSLPLPSTFAMLSLGSPITTSNVSGLLLLLAYTHGVRILYYRLRVPIILAILLSALGYCALAVPLAAILPTGPVPYWSTTVFVMLGAYLLLIYSPNPQEKGYKTTLPLYLKLPLIALIIFCLILIKRQLGGFMTVFPMVGMIAAYESRHCLWAICRQMPILILTYTPMIATIRLAQTLGHLKLGPALLVGWLVLLILLVPITRYQWSQACTDMPDKTVVPEGA